MPRVFRGSVTRIADLPTDPLPHHALERSQWEAGDYVVAEVLPRSTYTEFFELADGRKCRPMSGDLLLGALAVRRATLEHVGSYEDVGPDGHMHALSEGGCFGALTSASPFAKHLLPLRYRGHLQGPSGKLRMRDFVPPVEPVPFDLPVVLLVGTSMSSGKTFSGRVAVRALKKLGHRVAAGKLTGTGRWQDTLSMQDAGADHIFDFVDAGLPTTVCPPFEYREAIQGLLSRFAGTGGTVCVIEAGASPLEPYNGGTLTAMLGDNVAFTILSASDPYAVVGIQTAWQRSFDIVAGPTANTEAGVELVRRLSGLPTIDLLDHTRHPLLEGKLETALAAWRAGRSSTDPSGSISERDSASP